MSEIKFTSILGYMQSQKSVKAKRRKRRRGGVEEEEGW
jgi:hypothetical protein